MSELSELKKQVAIIQQRNKSVEANKAWETSFSRRATVCLITYLTANLLLFILGVKDFYLSAIVPTAGFILSTLSLPPIKKWWIRKYLK